MSIDRSLAGAHRLTSFLITESPMRAHLSNGFIVMVARSLAARNGRSRSLSLGRCLIAVALLAAFPHAVMAANNAKECMLQLKELTFKTDFANMTSYTADFKSKGNLYVKPDWTDGGKSNSIVHGMGLTVQVVLKVINNDIERDFVFEGKPGDPRRAWIHFHPTTVHLKHGENITPALSGEVPIPKNIIHDAGGDIAWTMTCPDYVCMKTTTNIMYVTADKPYASTITEWRVSKMTEICDGNKTTPESIDSIDLLATAGLDVNVHIHRGDEQLLWKMAAGFGADCISCALYWNRGIEMLGWPKGVEKWVYPRIGKKGFDGDAKGLNDLDPRDRNSFLGYLSSVTDLKDTTAVDKKFFAFEGCLEWPVPPPNSFGTFWLGGAQGLKAPDPTGVMKLVCKESVYLHSVQGAPQNDRYYLGELW